MTRNQIKHAAEALAWNGPMTRSKVAAQNHWNAVNPMTFTIEDVAAATVLMDLKDTSWDSASATSSIAERRPRRSCRRD